MAHLKVNSLKISGRGIRHALIDRLISRRLGPATHRRARPHRLGAALSFAKSLDFERKHGERVQEIALSLFDQLAHPLDLDPVTRDLLAAAALLHDVGYVVSFRQHHKHAYHLISHAPLEGFTPNEREIVALVARYHRRALPRKKHRAWAQLPLEERDQVRQLAALLRIADALDRRHSGELGSVRCTAAGGRIHFLLEGARDLGVETHAAEEKADLFRMVFGVSAKFDTRRARSRTRRRTAKPSARSS